MLRIITQPLERMSQGKTIAIAGNIGLLGDDYPGYYPVGDERALAALLARAEGDAGFLHALEAAVKARRSLTAPAAERRALGDLVATLPRADPRSPPR